MNPNHNGVIADMAAAIAKEAPFSECHSTEVVAALRAAAERGYRLAKIPAPLIPSSEWEGGYNEAINAIETIEIEKEQQ